MNTTLTIVPAAVQAAVKPKPTRNEIIDAMTQLRCEQIRKDRDETTAKMDALAKQIRTLAFRHLKKNLKEAKPTISFYGGCSTAEVEVSFKYRPAPEEIAPLIVEHDKLRQSLNGSPRSVKEVRKLVEAGLRNMQPKAERVTALLTDPESRKALVEALAQIAA